MGVNPNILNYIPDNIADLIKSVYNAKLFLSFARFFMLKNKNHLKYRELLDINNILDISKRLEKIKVNYIGLLSSESFDINKNNRLTISNMIDMDLDLQMRIPINVITKIINNNLSWDESTIGYWFKFYRYGNTYETCFWRLLQAPHFVKNSSDKPTNKILTIVLVSQIL